MQVYFQNLEHDPNHVAWVQCEPEDLDDVRAIFPVEKYEILVGLKQTYDPLTCDTQTLYNPPSPIWGVDVRIKDNAGHKDLSLGENS